MTASSTNLAVRVDPRNPGHVFACCGLLELAFRLWPGAEGWFSEEGNRFEICLPGPQSDPPLQLLIRQLCEAELDNTLEPEARAELQQLAALGKKGRDQQQERRLKELESRLRTESLRLGPPFQMRLDWWQEENSGGRLKTWAGQQKTLAPAVELRRAMSAAAQQGERILDYACQIRLEPFYFDARRCGTALDIGFSPDELDLGVLTWPAVEFLALVGLQRFRPKAGAETRTYEYCLWNVPLAPTVGRAAICGGISVVVCRRYQFTLVPRDQQYRYKGFGYAIELGGRHE